MSLEIETVEMHTGGEPVRIVAVGLSADPGRHHPRQAAPGARASRSSPPPADVRAARPLRHVRRPPGRARSARAPISPCSSCTTRATRTMCGHAVIALGRWAVDRGLVPRRRAGDAGRHPMPLRPGARPRRDRNGKPAPSRFESVPAFAFALDAPVAVPGYGPIHARYRLWRRLLRAAAGRPLRPRRRASPTRAISSMPPPPSPRPRKRADPARPSRRSRSRLPLRHHPHRRRRAPAERPTANICVFAAREVDRSPTGSGVTARLAVQHARGRSPSASRGASKASPARSSPASARDDARRQLPGGHRRGRRQRPLHRHRPLHAGGGGRDREGVSVALRLSPRPVPKSLGSPLVMVGEGRPSTSLSVLASMPARLSVSAMHAF